MRMPPVRSIGAKITVGFLVLVVIIFVIGAVAYNRLRSIETIVSLRVMEKSDTRSICKDIVLKNGYVFSLVKEYTSIGDDTRKLAISIIINDELRTAEEYLRQVSSRSLTREEKDLIELVQAGFIQYKDKLRRLLIRHDRAGETSPETRKAYDEYGDIYAYLTTQLLRLDTMESGLMYDSWNEAMDEINSIKRYIAAFGCIAFVISILSAFFIIKSITRPIARLVDVLKRFGGGDFGVRAAARNRDEIGYVSRRINAMLEQIQAAHRQVTDIIDFLPDATFVIDKDRKVIAWNRAIEEMTGVRKEAMLDQGDFAYAVPFYGKPRPLAADLVFGSDPATEKLYGYIERKVGSVYGEAFIQRLHEGRGGYVWIIASPLFDSQGNITGAIESMRDITDRKRSEEALRESEEKFRLISMTAQDAIIMMDNEGRVSYWNPAAERILGYAREEIVGQHLHHALAPSRYHEDYNRGFSQWQGSGTGSAIGRVNEFNALKKDGSEIAVELSVSSVMLGDKWHAIGILRDVTERRKIGAQLLQAQKMEAIGTLASGIAHDFNNILTGIQGYVSLLLLETDKTHPHHEWLENIEEQVRNGAGLTKQLLGIARGGKFEVKPANLNKILAETAAMFGRTRKEILIHTKYDPDIWTVEVDQAQIEQVLLNLFVNAWQAMPAGGHLYLETRNDILDERYTRPYSFSPGRYVRLSVTDTGIGMDEKTRERIFEPFFTTKELGHGTGLGLSSVYGIVKAHAGIITVYSEKGHGTTFKIHLPASERRIEDETAREEEPQRGEGTILLVDDEQIIVDVGVKLLENLGYKVLVARNGEDAVALYREKAGAINLVILDMIMPGMGGGQTFEALKAIDPEVRVILASGYTLDSKAREIMDRGCRDFIQKPFTMLELSQKINAALASHGV